MRKSEKRKSKIAIPLAFILRLDPYTLGFKLLCYTLFIPFTSFLTPET